jgi:hypothetical protein
MMILSSTSTLRAPPSSPTPPIARAARRRTKAHQQTQKRGDPFKKLWTYHNAKGVLFHRSLFWGRHSLYLSAN